MSVSLSRATHYQYFSKLITPSAIAHHPKSGSVRVPSSLDGKSARLVALRSFSMIGCWGHVVANSALHRDEAWRVVAGFNKEVLFKQLDVLMFHFLSLWGQRPVYVCKSKYATKWLNT